ncbi:MAG: RimK/LysX family protein [Psychroflexus sp.]|nr:RimK/LysX family protein [Psychroflexus sp.]MDN6309752.1 RimK/LysX family protein [Psychroflexus sp.]
MTKKIIGRKDIANFPELGLQDVAIKIDTGAYTSSIHCDGFEEIDDQLHCRFIDEKQKELNHRHLVIDTYKKIKVKSSNGSVEERYQITSKIKLFNKIYQISLSLTNRSTMKNPVLIGRKFLNKKFIVDTDLENLSLNAATS